jgi:hypothetical protein
MYDKRSECVEKSRAERSTGATYYEEDMIFERWVEIAAVAWEGYQFFGAGGVCIKEIENESRVVYHAGALCSCHPIDERMYDPKRQVVIFSAECKPVVLEGWPSPPQSLKMFNVHIEDLAAARPS